MQRKALIVAGAAGPPEVVNGVLQRFGFGPAESAIGVAEASDLMRGDRYDLVVVPLQGMNAIELAALERESRKSQHTFLIGTAAQSDPDLIVRAMRSGIHEFLVYPPDPTDFAGAVDRLMRRTATERKVGTSIAVYSAKGGLGTTSVAVNIAFALAASRPDGRVALADLVTSGGDVRVMLNLHPSYDISDVVRKADRMDAGLLDSLLTACKGGVWVLPTSDDPETVEVLDGPTATTVIDHLRSQFGCTVVDCDHHMGEHTLAALDAADRVLLVTQLNVAALRSTQRTLALCDRLGYAKEKVELVVNRYEPTNVVSLDDAAKVLRKPLYFKLPNDYATSSASLTKGVPIQQQAPFTPLAQAYQQLAAKLDGRDDRSSNGSGRGGRLGRLFSLGRK